VEESPELRQIIEDAENGSVVEQAKLAERYAKGLGVPQDHARAVEWYRKAADGGYSVAQKALGDCHKEGQGVPQDHSQAAEWYRKAADGGYTPAQTVLGDCYAEGLGVPQDHAQAVVWYLTAADGGYVVAQKELGDCYAKGLGVPQDHARAAEWYQKAADGGYTVAQTVLGDCYAEGRGVTQDHAQAAEWYRKAANEGYTVAQTELGDCYAEGRGVPQDHARAVEWYRKAADGGYSPALHRLDTYQQEGGEDDDHLPVTPSVTMADEPQPAQQRVMRVFVSSTFRDMSAERDELGKRVFLQLRKLCEERGVVWGDVDLRWGITDEQKAEGKVLPICLEEIHRCRPYFIGLLGERYGWIPDEISQELVDREPWLDEHRHRSMTELEILHGVLNNPDMADHAFFYFRSPAYIDSLPTREQRDYLEQPWKDEVERLGPEEAQRRSEERRSKLAALKDRIRASGFPFRENYEDPQDMGRLVLEDLTAVIDRLYSEESIPDPLDREVAEHEAFAASRRGIYIGREEYFERLDEHAQGDGPPLVVLGDSGSGKSALLANWASRHQQLHPEESLFLHFIGASPHSADWMAMLRRILGEFHRRLGIEMEIPDQPDALRQAFANALHMAAEKGRIVLVFDALNQLEDRDQALDLVWLPPEIPADIRLILSTLPGRPLEDLTTRGWPTMQVEPLKPEERRQLIKNYLAQYTKALPTEYTDQIAGSDQAANPLFLRVLLEELRLYGDHDTLGRKIGEYLSAETVVDLYQQILENYERDYERERPGLVRESMSLLWAARRGLSEAELLEMLGTDGRPLPRAHWSPLYLRAERALVNRSGLIGFGHDYLRQAAEANYVPTDGERRERHLQLADYFGDRDLGPRKVDELPWHLGRAEEWQRLHDVLADLPFFEAAWGADSFEVKAYWAQVEKESPLRLEDAYRRVIEEPSEYTRYLWNLAALLHDIGHPGSALKLREHLVEHYRATGDRSNLQASLGNQANILYARGDLDGAMALHEEVEQICRELGNKDWLQTCLGNQANILSDRGNLAEATALHEEQERICRELGNMGALSGCLGNQANVLSNRGNHDGAIALLKEQERICRELGDKDGLQTSLGNQGYVASTRGDLDEAMALYKEQERICQELGNKEGLLRSLGNQGNVFYARGDLDEAMALYKEQERFSRELGNLNGLQTSLGNQGNVLSDRGDLDGAMELYEEQERICRELGNKDGLQTSLGCQAPILHTRGDLDGAMALYKEGERICRELGNRDGLQATLGGQAVIILIKGDPDGATALYKAQEEICRDLGNEDGLASSLGGRGNVLYTQRDLDGAMVFYKEQERIYRELGNKDGLQTCLGYQANVLSTQGDLHGSIALHKEVERICRELGNPGGLAVSLGNQALILARDFRQPQEALPLAEEAHDLALRHGLTAAAEAIEPVLNAVRTHLRRV
jgi:TPR repeat protein/tetratricopeptide (TPR) repeat protein